MVVLVNGNLVDETEAKVSIFDRSFLYGDGLFETIRVHRGRLVFWAEHIKRLEAGARYLGIRIPGSSDQLLQWAEHLLRANAFADGVLRLTISRGVGPRGYSPSGAVDPALAMSVHSVPGLGGPPPRWLLVTALARQPADELATVKSCNQLRHILARAEAEAKGGDEALILNAEGYAVEGAASNLFWVEAGTVCTCPVSAGVLPGITRAAVLALCKEIGIPVAEKKAKPHSLLVAAGIFMTLSTWGVVEAVALDGQALAQSQLTGRIQAGYSRRCLSDGLLCQAEPAAG